MWIGTEPKRSDNRYRGLIGQPVDLSDFNLVDCVRFSARISEKVCKARYLAAKASDHEGYSCYGCPIGKGLTGEDVKERMITVVKAAGITGLSDVRIYEMLRNGEIPGGLKPVGKRLGKGRVSKIIPKSWALANKDSK